MFEQLNVYCLCTFNNDSLISMQFSTFIISSWFKFLPGLTGIHNEIDLISEKEIFCHNKDIVMQNSCFCFVAIIPADTEKIFLNSRLIPLFAKNTYEWKHSSSTFITL